MGFVPRQTGNKMGKWVDQWRELKPKHQAMVATAAMVHGSAFQPDQWVEQDTSHLLNAMEQTLDAAEQCDLRGVIETNEQLSLWRDQLTNDAGIGASSAEHFLYYSGVAWRYPLKQDADKANAFWGMLDGMENSFMGLLRDSLQKNCLCQFNS